MSRNYRIVYDGNNRTHYFKLRFPHRIFNMLLLAYDLPVDRKMDRATFYQYVDKEIELFYDELVPGSFQLSRSRGYLYPEFHLRSFEIWHFSYSFTRRLESHYYMSYDYNRPFAGFFYELWVYHQNLQYKTTGVAPARLTHRMEGVWQPLPVLIDDVPPDPPLDPKLYESRLIPGPVQVPSNLPETQPEPVPESPSVARRHISSQDSDISSGSGSIIASPKKKRRNNDVINLSNSDDDEKIPAVHKNHDA